MKRQMISISVGIMGLGGVYVRLSLVSALVHVRKAQAAAC